MMLGIVYVIYWFFDFLKNAVLTNNYSWLLWYSAAGFLITGIALIIQNIKLIYSLFCALFVVESVWIVDLFYAIFYHRTLFGLTEYILSPSFTSKDLYFTLYHALIPIGLLIAVLRSKKTYNYGWIGATIYAASLVVLTYFLTDSQSQVNCIRSINNCHNIFSFLYQIDYLPRVFIALSGLSLFVFIPTNYTLLYFKKNRKH